MTPFCSDCLFYEAFGERNTGFCHRYPPVPVPDPEEDGVPFWFFPETNEDQWCGEYRHE